MQSIFSRLFRTRSQSRRGVTRPIRRTSPLGFDRLDERILPSVSANLDTSTGILQIAGDSGNDNATVTSSSQFSFATFTFKTIVNVSANFSGGQGTQTFDGSKVSEIRFFSEGGTDSFTNNTGISAFFNGIGGQVTMTGGTGHNTFATDGDDSINPTGTDNVTFGLAKNLTPAELSAQGTLAAQFIGNTLTLSGPGGAGFKITGGTWKSDGATNETLTGSGSMSLVTALGNVPFLVSSVAPITIHTSHVDGISRGGEVTSLSLTGLPNLNVNGTGPLATLSSELGLNITLPNISWGLKLGSDSTVSGMNVPVNAGVPYLFATFDSGASFTFGNGPSVSVSGKSFAIAVDPSDPSIVVRYGDFAIGASAKGEIPFTPVTQPTGISTPIYGNLYGAGSVDLGDYPITISGNAVIDLDANNDGHILGLSGDTFHKLISGKEKLSDLALNAINDLAIGVNGTASLGYDLDGFNLSLPVANATIMYQPAVNGNPGVVAFRGDQPNLFDGTPLANLLPTALQNAVTPPRYFVDGSIGFNGSVNDWHLTVGVDNLVLGGSFTATHAQFTINNSGIHVDDVTISGLLGLANIDLTGDVFFNGSFDLKVTANAKFVVPKNLLTSEIDVHAGFTFDLEHQAGTSSTSLTVSAGVTVDQFHVNGIGDVTAQGSGSLTLTKDSSGVNVSGSGSVSATLDPIIGPKLTGGFGVSFDRNGFTIKMPKGVPDISSSWNGIVFNDLNGDGVQEPGEPGLKGYTLYLDLNDNGKRDKNEPIAVSDSQGKYSFGQFPDQKFVIRLQLPNSHTVLTDPFDNDIFDPSQPGNIQYHFGVRDLTAKDKTGAQVDDFTASGKTARVTFSEPINASTFTAADVTANTTGKTLTVVGITPVAGSNDTQFDIHFRQAFSGGVGITLGTQILDKAGNPLNQNGNTKNGEADDSFKFQYYSGPYVTAAAAAPGHIRVTFDGTINAGSFTAADVKLTDLTNHAVKVKGIQAVAGSEDDAFDILVGSLPKGGYKLAIGPNVTDSLGDKMDQNRNGISGEAKDVYTKTVKDTTAPKVTKVAGAWYGAVATFSEAIAPATLTSKTVQVTSKATGKAIAIKAIEAAAGSDGKRYFILVNAAPGSYTVQIGTAVTDLFGNHLKTKTTAKVTISAPPVSASEKSHTLSTLIGMLADAHLSASATELLDHPQELAGA